MRIRSALRSSLVLSFILCHSAPSFAATSLSLGADYLLRGVHVTERDRGTPNLDYYDQRLVGYLITDLSKDVEATIRMQSIMPWGFENSPTTLGSRYPDDHGRFFLQNAFVRLPNLWQNNAVATLGRQPIKWGDGTILSDDDLGFNAIRAQVKSPFRWLPIDVDAFTAKINETLQADKDTDLNGADIGFDSQLWRWDLLGLFEKNKSPGLYQQGAELAPLAAQDVDRRIYGATTRLNVKDAYIKAEYYRQSGSVKRAPGNDITLAGDAFVFGIGGKANTPRYGRFGANLTYAVGSGDDANTKGTDEAFRPDFAARWSGLERVGWGHYLAATMSDIRSSTSPFSPVTDTNAGLPPGVSGIQAIDFAIDATPFSQWTFSFEYLTAKAQRNLQGNKDIGTEFDYGIEYRFSGLVTIRAGYDEFIPKAVFDPVTKRKANMSTIEADVRF